MRARILFGAVVAVQVALVANSYVGVYRDPHQRFAFRMFPESSQWSAKIVRVDAAGRRTRVEKDWAGYRWSSLVRCCGLASPGRWRHAQRGIDSSIAYLAAAMDWVADHTPNDRETVYYEAEIEYVRNRREKERLTLRSKERREAAAR